MGLLTKGFKNTTNSMKHLKDHPATQSWSKNHRRNVISMSKDRYADLQDGYTRTNDDGSKTKVTGLGTPYAVLNCVRQQDCLLPHLVDVVFE